MAEIELVMPAEQGWHEDWMNWWQAKGACGLCLLPGHNVDCPTMRAKLEDPESELRKLATQQKQASKEIKREIKPVDDTVWGKKWAKK